MYQNCGAAESESIISEYHLWFHYTCTRTMPFHRQQNSVALMLRMYTTEVSQRVFAHMFLSCLVGPARYIYPPHLAKLLYTRPSAIAATLRWWRALTYDEARAAPARHPAQPMAIDQSNRSNSVPSSRKLCHMRRDVLESTT